MSSDAASLRAICAGVGFELDQGAVDLVERMVLLAEHTQVFDDAKRMADYAHDVFRHYERAKPEQAFSRIERQTVVLGCLFSDIGKTGPDRADAEARRLVAEMFAVEGVRDDQMSVATFFRTYFDADAERRLGAFRGLGLDPAMTMREFWNLHSSWTLGIAESAGLPPEAVAAAASHHYLDNVNPQSIVGEDQRFTRNFGQNVRFDRSEKLIIMLDKYDAARRRSQLSHEQAIAWIRAKIEKNLRFRDDPELATLLADVDAALGP